MVGHTNPLHLGPRKEPARPRTYRGHRRASWILEDQDALIELRARSRTFDGAYVRTALGHLYYALIVLKIFSPEFAKIGLIYVIMSCLLLLIAQVRRRRSDHDFSDKYVTEDPLSLPGVKASERLWGTRPFRTSGDTVILIALVCSALYITTFILIMRLRARNMIVKRERDDRPGSAEEEALLQQTEGIELTKQDVQEGYDVDLLDASPRGIGPSDASALPTSIPPSPTPSSTFPPASPAATTSLAPASSTTSLEPPFSDAVELLPVKSSAAGEPPKNSPRKAVLPATASPRNAAQVYAARARAAEFASDAKRKERVGQQGAQSSDGGVGEIETADADTEPRRLGVRRRRFKLSHLERRVWIWLAVVVFACIAIGVGVGVGVGLGLKHRGGDEDTSGAEDQQDAPVRPTMMGGDSSMRVPPEVTVPVMLDALPSSTVDDVYATPL